LRRDEGRHTDGAAYRRILREQTEVLRGHPPACQPRQRAWPRDRQAPRIPAL